MMITRVRLPASAWVLVALGALLMLTWSLVVPVSEAPDEPHHWMVARYMHDHWSLPHYDASLVEANQPPSTTR